MIYTLSERNVEYLLCYSYVHNDRITTLHFSGEGLTQ